MMGWLPRDRSNRILFVSFLSLWAISSICVPYPEYFWMQHVPTVLAVIALVVVERHLDRLAFSLIIAFLLLHLVGARYLYSYVPYDDWCYRWLNVRITDLFEFRRNHFDRLVHFCFGLLMLYPADQLVVRHMQIGRWWAVGMAVGAILAASAVYEIAEWLVAITFASDWADAYNGQQGDSWDAQWDMALAGLGAAVAAGLLCVWGPTAADCSGKAKRDE